MLTKALDVIALPKANLKKMNIHQLVELIESRINESFMTEFKNDNLDQLVGTRYADYSDKVEQRYRLTKRFGSAKSVNNVKSATFRFCKNPDLLLSEITETFLDDFEARWKGRTPMNPSVTLKISTVTRLNPPVTYMEIKSPPAFCFSYN